MLSLLLAFVAQAPNVEMLPVGGPRSVLAVPGYTCLRSGARVTADDVAAAADGLSYVFVGESHDDAAHHRMQADVIRALVARGRRVAVGFEMFTRPSQPNLAAWSLGKQTEEEFVERSGWRTDWNMDFELYRPIFEAVHEHRLPMVALNVPRDWVRAVGRGGLEALTDEQRAQLPEIDLGNAGHRAVFEAMMGGHPPGGTLDRTYAAMVLWDEAMADAAIRYMAGRPNPRAVMVIVAGKGHGLYHQGIDWRIAKRTGSRCLTVIGLDGDEPRRVSAGLGDYAYLPIP